MLEDTCSVLARQVPLGAHDWRGVSSRCAIPITFARVTVDAEARTLAWPNGADMAPGPLYAAARQASSPAAAATLDLVATPRPREVSMDT
jgi:hypothetical protein